MDALTHAPTPALILDRSRLTANATGMLRRAHRLGVGLRPHLKTLKSIDAARHAIDSMHGGIAVATFNEAMYFARHGIDDIQLAVCLAPTKFTLAAEVLQLAPRFSFFTDSLTVARAAADFASTTGVPLRVWIEIESGGQRTGVRPDDPQLLQIAAALQPHVELAGVATHAGQSYADLSVEQITDIAEQERLAVTAAAQRLRDAGHAVSGVSAGSTPTTAHARTAEGLTEWRAGVYLTGDLFQVAIGSLTEQHMALSVLATVISHQRERRQIVIDAGGLALSKDRSTRSISGRDRGYGLVADIHGRPIFGDLHVVGVHQEHGDIRDVTDAQFAALPLGSRVRIFPNHACMTAAMYEAYLVVDDGIDIVGRWPRTNGW
jgi:D-serine deaminase-like pyridoxal phosphate-dependent protein